MCLYYEIRLFVLMEIKLGVTQFFRAGDARQMFYPQEWPLLKAEKPQLAMLHEANDFEIFEMRMQGRRRKQATRTGSLEV